MADRYWVGGTANWDGTAGTKWATTSGGPGGASVPTTADDVFFDASSTGTVTISSGNTGAKSLNCSSFTGSFAGTGTITIAGSITFGSGMFFNYNGTVTVSGTGTITTSGVSLNSNLIINGSGITVTLADSLTLVATKTLTVTAGTFNTANFNVTLGSLSSSGSSTRTINLGSSTITINSNLTFSSSITFNAGTSQINFSSGFSYDFDGADKTFYNVSFAGNSIGSIEMTGSNTFNNLTVGARTASASLSSFIVSGNQTITGTFSINAGASNATYRWFIYSDTLEVTRTFTVAALVSVDCDFRDITLAGAASGSSPTRAGDAGGNSGITFPAAKTVYRVGADTTWGGSSSWATSSGGVGANNNFPLAQDTAIIDNDAAFYAGTLTISTYNIGTMNSSACTLPMTLSHSASNRYGSTVFGSGVTISGLATQNFYGRGTMDFTSAGKTITFPISINSGSGTLRLLDNYSATNAAILVSGTLNLNGFGFQCLSFSSNYSNTRALVFGGGSITLTGTGTVWNTSTVTNLSVTGTPIVNVTNATSIATTVTPGSPSEANSISFNFTAGTYSLTLSAGNYRSLNFTGFSGTLSHGTKTIYGDLTLSSSMTLTPTVNITTFGATSGTKNITTNGKALTFGLSFQGAGGTWRLLDSLLTTTWGSVTHGAGTVDLNGYNFTVELGYYIYPGTKNITFNGGTLVCKNTFDNSNPTGFTTTAGTGTGKISMTRATSKTFVGGGSTYNCTLSNDGAGALTISGSNTITTIANGVQPTTFSFTAGTTTTIENWNISGTAGNLVVIQSDVASPHTLVKSTPQAVSADYLSITQSTALGSAGWYAGANSINGGNNSGWIFTAPPVSNGGFFMLMRPGG